MRDLVELIGKLVIVTLPACSFVSSFDGLVFVSPDAADALPDANGVVDAAAGDDATVPDASHTTPDAAERCAAYVGNMVPDELYVVTLPACCSGRVAVCLTAFDGTPLPASRRLDGVCTDSCARYPFGEAVEVNTTACDGGAPGVPTPDVMVECR